jgi:hypothetical protein
MKTNENDNLDGFTKQTKYFLQSKMVQAINTVQCTGIGIPRFKMVSSMLFDRPAIYVPASFVLCTAQFVIKTKMSICKKTL